MCPTLPNCFFGFLVQDAVVKFCIFVSLFQPRSFVGHSRWSQEFILSIFICPTSPVLFPFIAPAVRDVVDAGILLPFETACKREVPRTEATLRGEQIFYCFSSCASPMHFWASAEKRFLSLLSWDSLLPLLDRQCPFGNDPSWTFSTISRDSLHTDFGLPRFFFFFCLLTSRSVLHRPNCVLWTVCS